MSTLELKQKIIEKIESIEDDNLLAEIYRTLEISQADSDAFVLTPAMRIALDEGFEDVKHGRVISNDEANKEIDEWLAK